jgi:hypothetical protein
MTPRSPGVRSSCESRDSVEALAREGRDAMRYHQSERCLLMCVTACLTGSLVLVACDALVENPGRATRREEFQSLVGGLGFGSSIEVAPCEFDFDPRLRGGCSFEEGPIPGGFFLCPHHAGRFSDYPSLPTGVNSLVNRTEHAKTD